MTPPAAAKAEPTKKLRWRTCAMLTPKLSAISGSVTVARQASPSRVRVDSSQSSPMESTAPAMAASSAVLSVSPLPSATTPGKGCDA